MNKIILLTVLFISSVIMAAAQVRSPEDLQNEKIYTSLEEALLEPENVFRFKLKKCKKCDSIPEEIFQLYNLQELNISGLKIKKLNVNISKLARLQFLNVSNNQLKGLPESIGLLKELKSLIINRNKIETLPITIANLHKLTMVDAWDNPLYTLPKEIEQISNNLRVLDLRQIPLKERELEEMERLLPLTNIIFTSVCECNDGR